MNYILIKVIAQSNDKTYRIMYKFLFKILPLIFYSKNFIINI